MNKSKKIIITLSILTILMFISLALFADSYDSNEAIDDSEVKIAKIIKARSVVFADQNLTMPLGYIPRNKHIAIGKLIQSQSIPIHPVLVSGRMAYIKQEDILYLDGQKINDEFSMSNKEHDIDLLFEKETENLKLNNEMHFYLGRLNTGEKLTTMFERIEGIKPDWSWMFYADFIHRHSDSRLFYGASFEYQFLNLNETSFKMFIFAPIIGLNFARNDFLSFDLQYKLILTTGTDLKTKQEQYEQPSPFIYGSRFSAKLSLINIKGMRPNLELFYQMTKIQNLQSIYNNSAQSVEGANGIHGQGFAVGLSFLF